MSNANGIGGSVSRAYGRAPSSQAPLLAGLVAPLMHHESCLGGAHRSSSGC